MKCLGPQTPGVDGTRRVMGSVLMEDCPRQTQICGVPVIGLCRAFRDTCVLVGVVVCPCLCGSSEPKLCGVTVGAR